MSDLKQKKMGTFASMNWSILFTIAIFLLLFRIFRLRVRANAAKTESFKSLPARDQLAVLKECLLNNPSNGSLSNLQEFCEKNGISFDAKGYAPYIKKQLELANRNANYVECDALYVEECSFIDNLRPLEFAEAEALKAEGDEQEALVRTLEGISRLYSDQAIKSELEKLKPTYPKAETLIAEYDRLVEKCAQSSADDKALEALRKERDAWHEALLTID